MSDNNLIAKFKLGGMEWDVVIDNKTCENNDTRWVVWYNRQTIGVRDFTAGINLNYETIERDLWAAIFNIIVIEHMEHKEDVYRDALYAMSGLFYQAISTLTSRPGEWDGSYKVGGVEYLVIVNNIIGSKESFFGRCNPNNKTIYLTTKNYGGIKHKDEFTLQTLIHEILHSINSELGKESSELDTEKFINTLSTFLYEVHSTIKIKFPDETDT